MSHTNDTDPGANPGATSAMAEPPIPRALMVAGEGSDAAFLARSLSAFGLEVLVFTDLDDAVDFVSGDRGGPDFFLVHQVREPHDLVRAEGMAAAHPSREVIGVPFYVLEEHREDPTCLHALVRRGAVSANRAVDRIGAILHTRRMRSRLDSLRSALHRTR